MEYKSLNIEMIHWDGSLEGANAVMEWMGLEPPETDEAPRYMKLSTDVGEIYMPPGAWMIYFKDRDEYRPAFIDLITPAGGING